MRYRPEPGLLVRPETFIGAGEAHPEHTSFEGI
jgi:hypothetical protein